MVSKEWVRGGGGGLQDVRYFLGKNDVGSVLKILEWKVKGGGWYR